MICRALRIGSLKVDIRELNINSYSATYIHTCKACSATVSARDSSVAVLKTSLEMDWNWPTMFIMYLLHLFIGVPE